MTRRTAAALALGIIIGFALPRPADAAPRGAQEPQGHVDPTPAAVGLPPASPEAPYAAASFSPTPSPTGTGAAATGDPLDPAPSSGTTITGRASWYCQPGRSACTRGYPAAGLYAAAGPALRVGDWRGREVTVCATRCVAVTLVDACQCHAGTDRERVVDLYGSTFAQLASLSRGVIAVEVRW